MVRTISVATIGLGGFPAHSPTRSMKLLVVIVNYKTAALAIDCLQSLAGEVRTVNGGITVVVTDNASADGSVEQIRAAIEQHDWTWASVQPLETNGGFAYGNDRGI